MDIKRLGIANFLAIKNASIEFKNRGLVLIQGENKDDTSALSNGSGKSSIADAICWAIYGTTARGDSTDSVVNDKAKKDASVEIVLEDGEKTYRITRYRLHSTHKNELQVVGWPTAAPKASMSFTKGTSAETQEVINNIMGCSLNVFVNSIYSGQEEMPDLPKMSDKALKIMIEEAAGSEILAAAYKLAMSKVTKAENAVVHQRGRFEGWQRSIEDLETEISDAERAADLIEKAKMPRIKAMEEEIANQGVLQAGWVAKHGSLAAVEKVEKGINEAIDKVRADIAAITPMVEKLKEKRALTSHAKTELAEADISLRRAVDNLAELRSSKVVSGTHECPTCHQPLTAESQAAHEAAHKTIEAGTLEAIAKRRAIMESLKTQYEARKIQEEEFEKTIPNLTASMTELSSLQTMVGIKSAQRHEWLEIEKEINHLSASLKSFRTEKNPYEEMIKLLQGKHDHALKEKDASKLFLEVAEAELALALNGAKVFSPAGVRAHILDTVTPFLNERTEHYLSALSDGNSHAVWSTLTRNAKGELKEKFSIDVRNSKGGSSFTLLSGGEKRKVRLATALALQDLVSSRAVKPINIWIGDEIDQALDVAGLERLMTLLESKARERGTVLVISHQPLADWIDKVITVTKEGGSSTVKGEIYE